MIHQSTDKKNNFIFLIIAFLFLSTVNIKNKNFIFGNVEAIKVIGLDHHLNKSIQENLKYLNDKEILSINKEELSKKISSYNYIENFKVSKLYPDNLVLTLKQTTFLASTLKQNKKYLIGTNAKLIDHDIFANHNDLPTIYGNFKPEDFILLKNKIKNSPLEYNNIINFFFYPSFRWDIENKNNIINAYIGANTLLYCKYFNNSFKKYSYFKEGKKMIEEAIKLDPDNLEIKFLRFINQTNAPWFLNYKSNIKDDYKFISSNLNLISDESFKRIIVETLKAYK